MPDITSLKVAVIGAGPAGLVTARELLREGHIITVFEKSTRVGGTWVYDPRTDSDPTPQNPTPNRVHSSLYASLRTNLPRPLMGFSDYPFPELVDSISGDGRSFPGHEEVLGFLEKFARDEGVVEFVRFGAEVVRVWRDEIEGEWVTEWRGGEGDFERERFEAVVVCNGHHSEPRLPEIRGIDNWPGKQLHSHNYRIPEPFQDQVVVIIGMSASAIDLSVEISKVAKEVHIASRCKDIKHGKMDGYTNMWRHSMVEYAHSDGSVTFQDGEALHADIIFYCTGYKYHFPFLQTKTITVDDNRVGPLYQHVFPPQLAPSLSFVGLSYETVFFTMLDFQAKWVARVLSNKIVLPSAQDMLVSVEKFYHQLDDIGMPTHHTHRIYPYQVEYLNWLASKLNISKVEDWKFKMYDAAVNCLASHTDGYRDKWDAEPYNFF